MYQRILFASDGSPASDNALKEAVKLAQAGAELRVLTVVPDPLAHFVSPYGMAYDAGPVRNAAIESGRAALEATVAKLSAQGVKATGELLDLTETASTNIAAALLEEAKSWPADLIVMGTHGRRGVRRFFLGSVAEELARCSPLPLLLVRGQED
ncbi:MAG: universal stress protein [Pedobacter sp.]|nr:universal stress protein [Pedobacter sp.]